MAINYRKMCVFVQELDSWLNFDDITYFRNFIRNYARISRSNEQRGVATKVMQVKYNDIWHGYTVIILDVFDENKYWADARRDLEAEKARLMEAKA